MKKQILKVLSAMLCIVLLLSAMPLTSFAVTASGTCGENVSWYFDSENGQLTISGTGDMKDFSYYRDIPWREQYNDKIKTVLIEDGVTSIGSNAFTECINLNQVSIGNSVTKIGCDAFRGCENLAEITVPDSVLTIGSYAFSDCAALKKASLGNGVTQIDYGAFFGCANLKGFSMPANTDTNSLFYYSETPAADEIVAENARINITWSDQSTTTTKLTIGTNFDDTDFVEAISDVFGFVESIELHPDNESFRLIDGVLYDSEVKTLLVYPTASDKTTYIMPDTVENDLTEAYSDYNMAALPAAKNLKEITFGGNYLVAQIEEYLTEDFIEEYSAAPKAEKRYLLSSEFSALGNKFHWWFLLTDIEQVNVSDKNKYLSADNGMLMLNCDEYSIILHQMQKYVDTYTLSENIITTETYPFLLSHINSLTVSDGYAENAYESAKYKYQNEKFTDEEIDRLAFGDIVLPLTSGLIAKEYSVSVTNKYLSVEDGVIFSKDRSMLLAYPVGSDRTVYELPDIDYLNGYAFSFVGEGGIIKNHNLTIHLSKESFEKTKTFHPSSYIMPADSGVEESIPLFVYAANAADKICVESPDYFVSQSYGIASMDDYNKMAEMLNENLNVEFDPIVNKSFDELINKINGLFVRKLAYAEICSGHELSFVERITEFFTNIFESIISFFSNILAWFAF